MFVDLAAALAGTGDYDRAAALLTDAEQAARSITDPDTQSRALGRLAAYVSTDRACVLIALALQVGGWTAMVDVLAHRFPVVLEAISTSG